MDKSINNEQKTCIMSSFAPKSAIRAMKAEGYNVFCISPLPGLNQVEGTHPDMQLCKITYHDLVCAPGMDRNALFELNYSGLRLIEGDTRLTRKYPYNIAYNVLTAGMLFFHNLNYTDPILFEALKTWGCTPVHVNQGYAACSSVALQKTDGGVLVMTGDAGIRDACKDAGFQTIWCEGIENVRLRGYDHGFMGGCCGRDGQKLYTCGRIEDTFDNASEIMEIIKDAGVEVISLCSGRLKDIGGIIIA
jgi:hypothetical protein